MTEFHGSRAGHLASSPGAISDQRSAITGTGKYRHSELRILHFTPTAPETKLGAEAQTVMEYLHHYCEDYRRSGGRDQRRRERALPWWRRDDAFRHDPLRQMNPKVKRKRGRQPAAPRKGNRPRHHREFAYFRQSTPPRAAPAPRGRARPPMQPDKIAAPKTEGEQLRYFDVERYFDIVDQSEKLIMMRKRPRINYKAWLLDFTDHLYDAG